MAAAREDLIGTSEKLGLAFSRFQTIGEQVNGLPAVVSALSLSEAAARVSKAARSALTEMAGVMKAAEDAQAAATKAVGVVVSAQNAKAAAEEAAKSAACAAARAAEVAGAAAAALEVVLQPPVSAATRRTPGASGKGTRGQGGRSSAKGTSNQGDINVALKTNDEDTRKDEEEGHGTMPVLENGLEDGHSDHDTTRSCETVRDGGAEEHGDENGEEENLEEGQRTEAEIEEEKDVPGGQEQDKGKGKRKSRGETKNRPCQTGRMKRIVKGQQAKRQRNGVPAAAAGGGSTGGKRAMKAPEPDKQNEPWKCRHSLCMRRASYGIDGTKAAKFCRGHAPEGMVNVISRRCSYAGCSLIPSYGVVGTKRVECCMKHASEGMIRLRAR